MIEAEMRIVWALEFAEHPDSGWIWALGRDDIC